MGKLKTSIVTLPVAASLILSSSVFAKSKKAAAVPAVAPIAASAAPGSFVLTPDSLREQILRADISVLTEMNQVDQAKQKVNLARATLLPSLNLGVLLNNPPNFGLSAVQILLPFLLPSNWFNLSASKNSYKAEASAFEIVQLNTYASAYAVAVTVNRDAELYDLYKNLLAAEQQLETTARARYSIGMADLSEVNQAAGNANLAAANLSQVQETLDTERAALREMLNLPLTTELTFADLIVPASTAEGADPQSLLPAVLARSPELQQIELLTSAARAGVGAASFGFLSSVALAGTSTGTKAGFSTFTPGSSWNLGFGIFPTVAISKLQVQNLVLQDQGVRLEQAQLLESNIRGVSDASAQVASGTTAETDLTQAYNAERAKYANGSTSIQSVLQVQEEMIQASVIKIKAETDQDHLRINLHRVMLTDEFANIAGTPCAQTRKATTIDQLCR